QFAVRASEVLAGNNFRLALFDEAVPTPLVSWAVRESGARGGVMITASHNPAEFNGFKIKAPFGGSAPPEITKEVESLVDATQPRKATFDAAELETILSSSIESYRHQVSSFVDLEMIHGVDAEVIVDPMHGSGGNWVESFLSGGRLRVETIRSARDPLFGGVSPEPIDRNL